MSVEPVINGFDRDHGLAGNWRHPDRVPPKGWSWDHYEYEEGGITCEMCDVQHHVNHVFTMSHEHETEQLRVGKYCAGWLIGDLNVMLSIDRWIKNGVCRWERHKAKQLKAKDQYIKDTKSAYADALAQAAWNRDHVWTLNSSKNYFVNTNTFYALVFKKQGHTAWMYKVELKGTGKPPYWSEDDGVFFQSVEDAQDATLRWIYPDPLEPDLSPGVVDPQFEPDAKPVFNVVTWAKRQAELAAKAEAETNPEVP